MFLEVKRIARPSLVIMASACHEDMLILDERSSGVPELGKFLSCRIGSGVMETVIILVSVDILGDI